MPRKERQQSGTGDAGNRCRSSANVTSSNQRPVPMIFMVKDRTRLKTLYDGIRNEVDMDAHLFIDGGQCADYLEENCKGMKHLSDNDYLLMNLIVISDFYTNGDGIQIAKCQWNESIERNNAQITAYGIKKEERRKRKSRVEIVLKPVKCP